MTILIAGGAGYLGSQLIHDLPKAAPLRGETIRILQDGVSNANFCDCHIL